MKLQVGNTTLESGTISHGTLRTEDLEDAFLPVLKDASDRGIGPGGARGINQVLLATQPS